MKRNRLIMRKAMLLCFIMASAALYALTIEVPYNHFPDSDLVRVTIIGDERGPLRQFTSSDYDRFAPDPMTCIEARKGERFEIRVENCSSERVGLVISVDDLNIVTGKRSRQSSDEGMYVLNPGQESSFSGWRSGMKHVQRFFFTSSENSYSSRLGKDTELGFIKVAVFRERQQIKYRHYEDEMIAPNLRPSGRSESYKSAESGPGTGYGESTYSPVKETEFDTEGSASQFVVIKYEWPDGHRYEYEHDHGHHDFAPPPPRRW